MNNVIIMISAMNTWPKPYIFRDTLNLPRTYSTSQGKKIKIMFFLYYYAT